MQTDDLIWPQSF